jgi:CRP/FNR family cyclic AMP-dependent transcriptional regulator
VRRCANLSVDTIVHIMTVTSLLAGTELFEGLDDEVIEQLSEQATQQTLRRNDVIFAEGDESDALFVVSTGRVAIANKSVDGRESVVALMEPGDLFGEMALFDGRGRSAEARALEQSVVVSIPFAPIRKLYEDHPEQLWRVVRLLAGRIRNMDEALADAVFLDVTGRTAKRLLELAGDKDEFVLPITQEELAGMVGASRERVNKAIAAFIRLGWIQQIDRRYVITNRRQLEIRAR